MDDANAAGQTCGNCPKLAEYATRTPCDDGAPVFACYACREDDLKSRSGHGAQLGGWCSLPPTGPLLGRTILVVHDIPLLHSMLDAVLRRTGYGVVLTRRSEDALAAVRSASPPIDLLVVGEWAGMYASELARRVRAIAPEVPIVFTIFYLRDAERPGINQMLDDRTRLLREPWQVADFLAAVRSLLPGAQE